MLYPNKDGVMSPLCLLLHSMPAFRNQRRDVFAKVAVHRIHVDVYHYNGGFVRAMCL